MGSKDARLDAYIAKSAPFARPILSHIRAVVHKACPKVEETMKWSHPHFMYEGMMCGMGAFKAHCTFGFWKGGLIVKEGGEKAKEAMGQFGRIESLADLPSDAVLTRYVKQAMRLNETGAPSPISNRKPKPPLKVPSDLLRAVRASAKARATFDGFSPSHRREYVEWITEAKTDETRQRRLATAVEWMAEGKSRNWKYINC